MSSLVVILFALVFGVYYVLISDVFSRTEKAVISVAGVSVIVGGVAVLLAVCVVSLFSL